MNQILALILTCLSICCLAEDSWLKDVQNRIDEDAVLWLRNHLSTIVSEAQKVDLDQFMDEQCSTCFSGGFLETIPQILVFMSFSVPDESWIKLSHELEQYEGIFVLRGLPNNSFQAYAKKLIELKRKGLNAEVQINPELFKRYDITHTPTFVVVDQDEQKTQNLFTKTEAYPGIDDVGKISGNISLKYVLEKFNQQKEPFKEKLSKSQFQSYFLPLGYSRKNLGEFS